MVLRIIFMIIILFTFFRLALPYMLSSQSTELVILGAIAFIAVIGFYLYKVETKFVDGLLKKFNKKEKD